MNLFSLENKIGIVTGACGLLGQHHCSALAEAGATVIVADLDESKCKSVANRLGAKHIGVKLDVTNRDSLIQCKNKILDQYHRIDILVNNAAIDDKFENQSQAIEQSMFENYSLERWNQSLSVNITGVFLCSQIFGSIMAEQGSG